MKNLSIIQALFSITLTLFASFTANAKSAKNVFYPDFYVEDENLTKANQEITKIIISYANAPKDYNNTPCKFIGKKISLSPNSKNKDWIGTTDNACAWAASAAPIWILKNNNGKYKVVLSYVAFNIKLLKQVVNKHYKVLTNRGSASIQENKTFIFNGNKYILIKK